MTRNDVYGGIGLALCVIDALIIWAWMDGQSVLVLRVIEYVLAWSVFACLAGYALSVILRTAKEIEREYEDESFEDNESTLYLSGDDDGSGIEPHLR